MSNMEASPNDSIMKNEKAEPVESTNWTLESQDNEQGKVKHRSGVLNVVISGLALFSDGYNAQNSMISPTPPFNFCIPVANRPSRIHGTPLLRPLQKYHVVDNQRPPCELLPHRRNIRHVIFRCVD